jgi:aspartate/methionine/tyrosine aminotransferase
MAMDARAKALQAAGRDLVNLTAGEPDFPTVPPAAEAGVAAIRDGFTRYTAAAGIQPLRAAIVAKLEAENGIHYSAEEIGVTTGAKFALFAAMQVLCDPGDEVVIPSPYWVSYPEQAQLAGAVPVFTPTEESDGFVLTAAAVERALTPRTKLLVLNSPCNPTGAVIPEAELVAIGEVVLRHPRVYVLSDEIYEKMVYDGARHASLAALDPELRRRTVTINGFSKAYSMTGWRVGYTAADAHVARPIAHLLSQTTSNVTSVAQRAALAALESGAPSVAAMVEEFSRRRELVLARLAAMPLLRCARPGGAFYVFPNVAEALGRRTPAGTLLAHVDAFSMALMEEGGLATVPGTGFGSAEHIRLSYAAATDTLASGCDRLAEFLGALR